MADAEEEIAATVLTASANRGSVNLVPQQLVIKKPNGDQIRH